MANRSPCLNGEQSDIDSLKLVLSGVKNKTEGERVALLELAVKVAICGLYEHYKEDVINTFSIEVLKDVVASTEPFRAFTVEHIYKTALTR